MKTVRRDDRRFVLDDDESYCVHGVYIESSRCEECEQMVDNDEAPEPEEE